MQIIIAPTDFSDISLNAVNYAADMAMALHARLLVLHATEIPFNVNEAYIQLKDDEFENENKLHKLKDDLIKRTGNRVQVHVKQVIGLIENEIMKIGNHKNPLAVVMATKGASIKTHFFFESITVYLSKNLRYPVIVVPEHMHYKPVNKILLATDLEHLYNFPIDGIKKIAIAFNAQVDIVHVFSKEDNFEVMSSRMSELTNYLSSLNPQFHFIYNRDVYKGIINFAKENSSDIILTFPKKHAFFHKSESKQLIFNAPFTVMTIQ